MFGIRTNTRISNVRVFSESSWRHFAQRSGAGKWTASWWPAKTLLPLFPVRGGADFLEGASGRTALPLRSQPVGGRVTFRRDSPSGSHSLVFFRTEGVDSAKVLRAAEKRTVRVLLHFSEYSNQHSVFQLHLYLMGWTGQLDCTGVGAAELGLISMAL